MKTTWIGLTLLALATAAAAGCDNKGGDAASPAPSGAAAPDKKEGDKAEAKPAAASGSIEDQLLAMMDKMSDIFSSNAGNCDKMAAEIEAFIKDNGDTFKKIKEFGDKQTPEEKKAFTEKHRDKIEATMKKMEPGIKSCVTNQKVQDAMKTMPL
jgi:hypothetical protein